MSRAVSIGTMVKQVCTLAGTKDVSEWEDRFVQSIDEQTNCGERTSGLSTKQVEVVERLWRKHFA